MLLSVIYCVAAALGLASSQALMAVDVGSEFLKASIVKIGMPMEIALNKESSRKTPNVIAFKDGQRLIGENAIGVGRRTPGAVVRSIHEIIGKKFTDPQVSSYMEKHKHLNITRNELTGMPQISIEQYNESFSPEELFAMILNETATFTSSFAGVNVRDVLLVFPPNLDYNSRRGAQVATKMTKLNLIGISDSSFALAIQYVLNRKETISSDVKNLVIVDVGSNNIIATVFQTGTEKISAKTVTPYSNISGISVSRIGASYVDRCLFDILIKEFKEKNNIKADIFKNPKVEHILRQESVRIKHVLTVNPDVRVHLEELYQDYSLITQISRQDMENKCSSFFTSVSETIKNALVSSSLNVSSVDIVIPVGGGSLIPKVQQVISDTLNLSPSRVMNTDDSVALGGSFLAASISKFFRVFKVLARNSAFYPILLKYNSTVLEDGENVVKENKDILHRFMAPLRDKKVLLIKNQTSDLSILVSYDLSPGMIDGIDKETPFMIVNVTGINDVVKSNPDYEVKHLSIHFSIDNLGITFVTNALLNLNRVSEPSLFEKVGKAVSSFIKKENDLNVTEQIHSDTETVGDDPSNHTVDGKDKVLNATRVVNSSASVPKNDKKLINVSVEVKWVNDVFPSDEDFAKSVEKLQRIQAVETQREEDSRSRSNLQRFLYETKDALESGVFNPVTTEEELQNLKQIVRDTEEWFDDNGFSSGATENTKRLNNLTLLFEEFNFRLAEEREMPTLIKNFRETINQSANVLTNTLNLPNFQDVVNRTKYDQVVSFISEAENWFDERYQKKINSSLSEAYRLLTTKMIKRKIRSLTEKLSSFLSEAVSEATKRSNNTTEPTSTSETNQTINVTTEPNETKHEDQTPLNETDSNATREETPQVEVDSKHSQEL